MGQEEEAGSVGWMSVCMWVFVREGRVEGKYMPYRERESALRLGAMWQDGNKAGE
jgi:hypothetical protein